jgi:outer membrane biosynthesis protein TonB
VIQHLGEGLDARVLSAVSQWRFERPLRDGVPAATMVIVEIKFHLRGKKS